MNVQNVFEFISICMGMVLGMKYSKEQQMIKSKNQFLPEYLYVISGISICFTIMHLSYSILNLFMKNTGNTRNTKSTKRKNHYSSSKYLYNNDYSSDSSSSSYSSESEEEYATNSASESSFDNGNSFSFSEFSE